MHTSFVTSNKSGGIPSPAGGRRCRRRMSVDNNSFLLSEITPHPPSAPSPLKGRRESHQTYPEVQKMCAYLSPLGEGQGEGFIFLCLFLIPLPSPQGEGADSADLWVMICSRLRECSSESLLTSLQIRSCLTV